MQAIEFKIRQRESRTGITRLNKGVDEDTLNDTAKGQAQLMSRGQQMERYIIRNFAEGVARLFMKKVGLMRKYAQPFQIRVDGNIARSIRRNGPRTWRFRWWSVWARGPRKTGSWAGSRWARSRRCSSNRARRSSATTISTTTRLAGARLRPGSQRPVHRAAQGRAGQSDSAAAAARSQGAGADGAGSGQAAGDRGAEGSRPGQAPADGAATRRRRPSWRCCGSIRRRQSRCASRTFRRGIDQQQMMLEAHKHAAQLDSQQKIAKMRPGGSLATRPSDRTEAERLARGHRAQVGVG
jgi:hypothetical protein